MTAGLIRGWIASGALELPLPGGGDTARRWRRLAELAEIDIVAGRLAEAHADAVAILAELGGPSESRPTVGGVGSRVPRCGARARARRGTRSTLDGTKVWCSGAGLCTHALVTARLDSGERGLFAVDLGHAGVRPLPSTWRNLGMAESDTRSVQFSSAPADTRRRTGRVLDPARLLARRDRRRACWLGGARAVAAPLYERAAEDRVDPHTLAHLGAVDAALAAGEAMLYAAAAEIDADPLNRKGTAELVARRTRAVVETAVDETITRTARALGPAPLCQDAQHAKRVADLTIYVRQSHAERDLERLGLLAGAAR